MAEALALLGEVPAKLVEADLVSCGPVISKLLRPEQGKYKSNQTLSATAQLLALEICYTYAPRGVTGVYRTTEDPR